MTSFLSDGSRFERCRLERTRIDTINFGAGTAVSTYVDCVFDGSRWPYVEGGWSRFERCSFRDVDVRKWNGQHTEFIDCVFSGRLRRCLFWGAYPCDQMLAIYENHANWHEKQGWVHPRQRYAS